jgi:hypothetical protein
MKHSVLVAQPQMLHRRIFSVGSCAVRLSYDLNSVWKPQPHQLQLNLWVFLTTELQKEIISCSYAACITHVSHYDSE